MEGFWRSAEVPLEIGIGVIIVTIVVYCLYRFLLMPKLELTEDEEEGAIGMANFIAAGAIIATIATVVWQLTSLSTNRLPRKELDRSEIYKQMESNTTTPEQTERK